MLGPNEKLILPADHLQKYFKIGDHIKVIAGAHEGETGLIVKIDDEIATVLADSEQKEVPPLTFSHILPHFLSHTIHTLTLTSNVCVVENRSKLRQRTFKSRVKSLQVVFA
jgi:transcription elongation factor